MKFSDVKNYFEGNFNYFAGAEEHIREQAQYRAILCYECLENKRCRGCGCNTPKVVLAPNKIDSKQR